MLARALAAGLLCGALAAAALDAVATAALPAIRAEIDAVDATYRTVDLLVVRDRGEALIERHAAPKGARVIGSRVVMPAPATRLVARAPAGVLLQPIVLAAALLFAWPRRGWRELAGRSAIAAPLVLGIVALDLPVALAGYPWIQELERFAPDAFSPLATWVDFMNAGGRFALTLLAVALAIAAAGRVRSRALGYDRACPPAARGLSSAENGS